MMRLDNHGRGRRIVAAGTLLAFTLACCPLAVPRAMAQSAAPADLEAAQRHYEFAEFSAALQLLEPLLASGGLAGDALRDAHVLKARCLVGVGRVEEARAAYCAALALDAGWAPDPIVFPREEIEVFDQARLLCPPVPQEAPTVSPGSVLAPVPARPSQGKLPPAAGSEKPAKKKKSFLTSPVGLALGGALLVGVVLAAGGGGGGGGEEPAGPLPGFPAHP